MRKRRFDDSDWVDRVERQEDRRKIGGPKRQGSST